MKAIVNRFKGAVVLVIQQKLVQTPGLVRQLLKILQHYTNDFILYFIHLVISLQCCLTVIAILKDLFRNSINTRFANFVENLCFRLLNVDFSVKS